MTPTRQPKIVGLGGSLATRSTSLAALKIALQGAADAGADVEPLDVGHRQLPGPAERFRSSLSVVSHALHEDNCCETPCTGQPYKLLPSLTE